MLRILDENDEERVVIKYKNFKYEKTLDENLFQYKYILLHSKLIHFMIYDK